MMKNDLLQNHVTCSEIKHLYFTRNDYEIHFNISEILCDVQSENGNDKESIGAGQ